MTKIPKLRNFAVKVAQFFGYAVFVSSVTHCLLEYIGDFVICLGPSMEPTIHSEDICFSEHISAHRQKINRGDIVITASPYDPKLNICKRVKAVAGDRVSHGFFTTTVPKGHIWLEGDNKDNSTDSRLYGPVPLGLIRGRIVCILWPPIHTRMFTGYQKQLA